MAKNDAEMLAKKTKCASPGDCSGCWHLTVLECRTGDPNAADERKTEDSYKTLFVGRISYETTEKQLRQEFEQYGPVKKVRLIEDEDGKSRGYAFVEYEKEGDMKIAYKQADGKKIDGRRVVVDVERGRTVRDWVPRKFGGGIGETRKGGADVNLKYSGRYLAAGCWAALCECAFRLTPLCHFQRGHRAIQPWNAPRPGLPSHERPESQSKPRSCPSSSSTRASTIGFSRPRPPS